MLQPTKTARSGFLHTHLDRGGSLMLQPTKTARSGFLHTHLVRGGSLMLQPTAYKNSLSPRDPTCVRQWEVSRCRLSLDLTTERLPERYDVSTVRAGEYLSGSAGFL